MASRPNGNATTIDTAPPTPPTSATCRLLTFNLNILPFGMRMQPGHDYKDDRINEFVSQAGAFDLLLLQEVFSSPFIPRLARSKVCRQQRLVAELRECGFAHHAVPSQPSLMGMVRRWKATDTGLVIVSKYPISDRASHVFQSSGSPRGILYAKVDLAVGLSLLCFTVRLTTGVHPKDVKEARQFIQSIAHRYPCCPIVIGGDLGVNSILQPAASDEFGFIYDGKTQQSVEYDKLMELLDPRHELTDVAMTAFGHHAPTRPPDASPMELDPTLQVRHFTACTDHLLVAPSVAGAVSAQPQDTAIVKFTAANAKPYKYLSDHFGVSSTLHLLAAAAGGDASNGDREIHHHHHGMTRRGSTDGMASSVGDAAGHTSPADRGGDRGAIMAAWLHPGHTVNDFFISGSEVILFVVLWYFSVWLAGALGIVFIAFAVLQRVMGTAAPEAPHATVTDKVVAGVASVVLPSTAASGKALPLPEASVALAAQRIPIGPTFNAAWKAVVKTHAWLPCLGILDETQTVSWTSYDDIDNMAKTAVRRLAALGVGKGAKIAVFADMSQDVVVCDVACMLGGICSVPLSGDAATVRCILDASRCTFAIVSANRVSALLESRSATVRTLIVTDQDPSPTSIADAAEHGLSIIRVKSLWDAAAAMPTGSASTAPHLPHAPRPDDVVSVLCDVGEEVEMGATRQYNLKQIDNTRFMALVNHIDACNLLAPRPPATVTAAAVSSQFKLPRKTAAAAAVVTAAPSRKDNGGTSKSNVGFKAALSSTSGAFLTHHHFSDYFERATTATALLKGIPVACGSGGSNTNKFWEDCRVVKPGVVVVTPATLFALRTQADALLARRWPLVRRLFPLAFAIRVRLHGESRDWGPLKFFFRHTERIFGGRLVTVIVPTVEHLSNSLAVFSTVCFAPRLREVAYVQECGIIAVNGIPPPNTLVRLVESFDSGPHDQHHGTQQQGLAVASAGEVVVSGPTVLGDAKDATGWAHTGVVGRWAGHALTLICPRDGLLWPMMDVCVASPQLEREYAGRTHLFHNIFITCKPLRPLVAVVVPRRDLIEEQLALQHGTAATLGLVGAGQQGLGTLSWSDFSKVARLLVLEELASIARKFNMPFAHLIRNVHLHPHPFAQHTSFFSQNMVLRRTRVAKYFSPSIDVMYSDLGRRAGTVGVLASTAAASSRIGAPLQQAGLPTTPHLASATGGGAASARRGTTMTASTVILRPRVPFAVDIGGTCAKIAYFKPPEGTIQLPSYCDDEAAPEDMAAIFRVGAADLFIGAPPDSSGGEGSVDGGQPVLRFLKMPSHRVQEFVRFMKDQSAPAVFKHGALENIPATGGGALRLSAGVAAAIPGVSLQPVKEMESIIRGMQLCIESAQDCIFSYDWREKSVAPHRLAVAPALGIYPFLVVNIGSGVSIVKCPAPNTPYVRVGGTPIGGGTFWGLARALTNVQTWDEVRELTRLDGPGDHTNVDLLVGDIYGFNAQDLPARLSVDTVASCFGKLGAAKERVGSSAASIGASSATPSAAASPLHRAAPAFPAATQQLASGVDIADLGASVGGVEAGHAGGANAAAATGGANDGQVQPRTRSVQTVDIVRSLLLMVATNITQIAHLVSQAEHVDNVFFTGGFVRENEVVWRHISRLTDYWSNGRHVAHFIQSDGFLGVMGALATASTTVAAAESDAADATQPRTVGPLAPLDRAQ